MSKIRKWIGRLVERGLGRMRAQRVGIFERYKLIYDGLDAARSVAYQGSEAVLKNQQDVHDSYFNRSTRKYSEEHRRGIEDSFIASQHRFRMANMSLEQLQAIRHTKRDDMLLSEVIELSLDRHEVSDEEQEILLFAFETFLFHARAFLDLYMLYVCRFLDPKCAGKISKSKFDRCIEQVISNQELECEKARQVKKHFEDCTFSDDMGLGVTVDNWGKLVRELRDKVAHRDKINPSVGTAQTVSGQVIQNWPMIQGLSLVDFIQYVENGMAFLIQYVSSSLYETKWPAQ